MLFKFTIYYQNKTKNKALTKLVSALLKIIF